jgi:hypothetical protein
MQGGKTIKTGAGLRYRIAPAKPLTSLIAASTPRASKLTEILGVGAFLISGQVLTNAL